MSERTLADLRQKQALPLEVKILLTRERVRQWIDEYGEDGVYISFSGGKDSTVLLDLIRNKFGYKNIPAVFVDTGLEYPEIRQFVKSFDNVEWLKPKMNFRQVIEKYGYPVIGKEVSDAVYYGRNNADCTRFKKLTGKFEGKDGEKTRYNFSKYTFLLDAPFLIGGGCCSVMKKKPCAKYEKRTRRVPFLGQMACESAKRQTAWLKTGCNAFNLKRPQSNPIAFWTEQDVLQYIYENKLPICSVYGEIVKSDTDIVGQMDFEDWGFGTGEESHVFKTTGCSRTGCMFCGYGCHLEKEGEGRFERMKVTHPKQYEYIMKPWDKGGLGYKEVIDWINENGNLHIRY